MAMMLQKVSVANVGTKAITSSAKMAMSSVSGGAIVVNEIVKNMEEAAKDNAMKQDFQVIDSMCMNHLLNSKCTQSPKEVAANYEKAATEFSLNDSYFNKLTSKENSENNKFGIMNGISKFSQKVVNSFKQAV